jgi:hypothetical protein
VPPSADCYTFSIIVRRIAFLLTGLTALVSLAACSTAIPAATVTKGGYRAAGTRGIVAAGASVDAVAGPM